MNSENPEIGMYISVNLWKASSMTPFTAQDLSMYKAQVQINKDNLSNYGRPKHEIW